MGKAGLASLVALASTLFFAQLAHADDEEGREPESHVTVAFSGGAFLPYGGMKDGYKSGLDVVGRVGWNSANGVGVVASVEYTPVRRAARPTLEMASHMFAAAAAPRYTLGHEVVRVWIAAGGGVVVEYNTTRTGTVSETRVSTVPTLQGASGMDLHVFQTGGLSVSGAYTRSLFTSSVYDFFSVSAGLVFTI